ncbi:MAG: D-alanyl-D-alanine carboxypeptidase, partial [Acidobacteria bacterium]|nr:D-alanyl-D-alanine carboxypeptidase [Acidobacteriota bacterium]
MRAVVVPGLGRARRASAQSIDFRRLAARPQASTTISQTSRLLALIIVLTISPACARAPRPIIPGTTRAARTAIAHLQRDFDAILGAPDLQRMTWAVLVRSQDHDDTLYQVNAAKLMMPASNMKLVTMAAAAERLGWDYRFETRLETSAQIEAGHLTGDLIVVGGGDPTINYRGPSWLPAEPCGKRASFRRFPQVPSPFDVAQGAPSASRGAAGRSNID